MKGPNNLHEAVDELYRREDEKTFAILHRIADLSLQTEIEGPRRETLDTVAGWVVPSSFETPETPISDVHPLS